VLRVEVEKQLRDIFEELVGAADMDLASLGQDECKKVRGFYIGPDMDEKKIEVC